MKISEQVAELEGRLEATANQAECYLIGIRAGLRDDVMVGTAPDGEMDRGWREGKCLRKIARMDLEGFRAGVLGETHCDGADPAFVAGYAEGEKVRAEAAVAMWEKIDAANRKALTEALGVEWGSERSVEEGIRRLSSLEKSWQARCVRGEAEAESRVKVGGNPPEPEIGMVYKAPLMSKQVVSLPWYWPDGVTEIRAPWGGPAVWRREPSNG